MLLNSMAASIDVHVEVADTNACLLAPLNSLAVAPHGYDGQPTTLHFYISLQHTNVSVRAGMLKKGESKVS